MMLTANSGHKPRNIRDGNLKVVLNLFRRRGLLTVQDISAATDLSKTTVNKLVTSLTESGHITQVGKGSSTDEGGKRPGLYAFNCSHAYILTVNIAPPRMLGAIYDLGCNLICEETVNVGESPAYHEIRIIQSELIPRLIKKSGIKKSRLKGLALGYEGNADGKNGVLSYPCYQQWETGINVKADLEEDLHLNVPVYVNSLYRFAGYMDASMAEDCDSVITIFADKYAGGCVVEKNSLVTGQKSYVGAFGHIPLEPDSYAICSCGSRGCFEALVRPDTVLTYAQVICDDYPDDPLYNDAKYLTLTLPMLFEAANNDGSFAQAVLERPLRAFAGLIHSIILMREPDLILIQGIYSNAGDFFLNRLNRLLDEMPFYQHSGGIKTVYSNLHFKSEENLLQNAGLGAALYIADEYLAGERVVQQS